MADRTLTIKNEISELERLAAFLEELGETFGLSLKIVLNLNLVLEELVTNIIFYGYEDKEPHSIVLEFTVDDEKVIISITDDAKPFDPTQKDAPDSLEKPIEDRNIGGLGIHLVTTLMDSFTYRRDNNHNVLNLIKLR